MMAGFYIGPFNKKSIKAKSKQASSPLVESTADVDFDWWFKELKKQVDEWGVSDGIKMEFRRATDRINHPDLDDSVQMHIRDCDFVIAVLAANNLNAHLELGFARAMQKPMIILVDGQIASDLQGVQVIKFDATKKDTSGSFETELSTHFRRVREEIEEKRRAEEFPATCYAKRFGRIIEERILTSERCIHILQTNLQTVVADHASAISRRLDDGVKLRILTMDPQNAWINERAQQLNYTEKQIGDYRGLLSTSLRTLEISLDSYSESVQIKVYNDSPTQMTYRFDESLLVCTVSRIAKSRDNVMFLVDGLYRPGIIGSFVDHFGSLWHASRSRAVFGNLTDDDDVVRPYRLKSQDPIANAPVDVGVKPKRKSTDRKSKKALTSE